MIVRTVDIILGEWMLDSENKLYSQFVHEAIKEWDEAEGNLPTFAQFINIRCNQKFYEYVRRN